MRMLLRNSFWLLAACLFFASCNSNCMSEQQVAIPQAAWQQNNMVTLTLPIDDSLSYCNIILTLRNNESYHDNNIILAITAKAPSGAVMRDTVEYELTDAKGAWLGRKGGKWIDHRLAFRTDVQFAQKGNYEFTIAHLMRSEPLNGIGAVGVRIEKIN